ncbi:hypothetical protein F4804DRAFT_351194 [Jackrogersella minutella]|nr:hypothetical protein F4804DRAFT_351194 [Jackrogersella minutella]
MAQAPSGNSLSLPTTHLYTETSTSTPLRDNPKPHSNRSETLPTTVDWYQVSGTPDNTSVCFSHEAVNSQQPIPYIPNSNIASNTLIWPPQPAPTIDATPLTTFSNPHNIPISTRPPQQPHGGPKLRPILNPEELQFEHTLHPEFRPSESCKAGMVLLVPQAMTSAEMAMTGYRKNYMFPCPGPCYGVGACRRVSVLAARDT